MHDSHKSFDENKYNVFLCKQIHANTSYHRDDDRPSHSTYDLHEALSFPVILYYVNSTIRDADVAL